MEFITLIGCVMYLLYPISAYDPFEGMFKTTHPCFDVVKTPTCNKTLAESFQPESPKLGFNEPTTLVCLFAPDSPDEAEPLHLCGGELPPGSKFDTNCRTEIFIHGWIDGMCRTAWMREMKEQLFQRGRYNVILVDWTWGNGPDRFLATNNLKIVGEQVGFIICNIMRATGVGPDNFHLIGHSLGAIASGFASRKVRSIMGDGVLIGRITGLDTSSAPFLEAPPEQRLTYRDAQIVDVIHSNGASCFAQGSGDIRPMGHADFYPNGGSSQASCRPYMLTSWIKGDVVYALGSLLPNLCNHLQSIQYYKVSINAKGCQFIGIEASSYEDFNAQSPHDPNYESWAVMGMDYELYRPQSDEARRKYYLNTSLLCPYYDDSYLKDRKPECAVRRIGRY